MNKNSPMTGFEPRTSGVRSHCSTEPQPLPKLRLLTKKIFLLQFGRVVIVLALYLRNPRLNLEKKFIFEAFILQKFFFEINKYKLKKLAHFLALFLYFCLLYSVLLQLIVNKIANDWIQAADLWCRKWPLCTQPLPQEATKTCLIIHCSILLFLVVWCWIIQCLIILCSLVLWFRYFISEPR